MFVFSQGDDVITDYTPSSGDQIRLTWASGITDFADLAANHMRQVGADVVIDDGVGNTMTLAAVSLAALDAGDFLF